MKVQGPKTHLNLFKYRLSIKFHIIFKKKHQYVVVGS